MGNEIVFDYNVIGRMTKLVGLSLIKPTLVEWNVHIERKQEKKQSAYLPVCESVLPRFFK